MTNLKNKANKDTEQLILEAAIKEFSIKGFDGARTSTIAAEAGVTHAMLHYYFRTKEKLFERIFMDKIQYILNIVLSPMIESEGTIKERISKGIERHFDFLLANRELPVFFITTLNSRPEFYREAICELFSSAEVRIGAFQRELDKAYGNGEIAKVDAAALLGDIASLNVFPFLGYPMMMAVTGYGEDRFEEYMESRKRENVEIILKRIS